MANETKLANLINPQVIADFVEKKLVDNMVFAPLCDIDYTLEGRPGDTLTFPTWNYIGDASVLSEASTLSVVTLSQGSASATVYKIAQGVEITDEAVLSGLGDPIGEGANQIALALANTIDNSVLAMLESKVDSSMTWSPSTSSTAYVATDIYDALELFGEDINGVKVAVVAPKVYTQMRKTFAQGTWIPASELAAGIAIRGVVGEFQGCQVIVSDKLKNKGEGFIVKPGSIRIIMKRGAMIESDRNILKFSNVITGSVHYTTYLYNASGVIMLKDS